MALGLGFRGSGFRCCRMRSLRMLLVCSMPSVSQGIGKFLKTTPPLNFRKQPVHRPRDPRGVSIHRVTLV